MYTNKFIIFIFFKKPKWIILITKPIPQFKVYHRGRFTSTSEFEQKNEKEKEQNNKLNLLKGYKNYDLIQLQKIMLFSNLAW